MELKVARQIARLTQQQLAEKVGCDHSLISHLESGRRRMRDMSYGSLEKLAGALNLTIEQTLALCPSDESPRAVNE